MSSLSGQAWRSQLKGVSEMKRSKLIGKIFGIALLFVMAAMMFSGLPLGSLWNQSQVLAQDAPEVEWSKIFGGDGVDRAHSMEQTSDGGYIFVGETMSQGSGKTDVWLVKIDMTGNQTWERTFGTTYLYFGVEQPAYDYGFSVQQTIDGGYIIVGACKLKGFGYRDDKLWLIKTDADGNLEWDRIMDTVHEAGSSVHVFWSAGSSVRQTTDGGYIIAGACQSSNTNHVYIWLIKTDANGDRVWDSEHNRWVVGWEKLFADPGLTGYEFVQPTSDGGYIVIGCKGPIPTNIWMIKTNSNGVLQWENTFGREYIHPSTGDVTLGTELPSSIRQTSAEGYIITATSQSGWDQRGWVIKTNAVGEMMWEIVPEPWTWACDAQQTTDGGYIIFGSSEDDFSRDCILLTKTDSEGNQLWEKLTDGWWVCGARDGLQTNDGGYITIADIKQGYGDNGDVWIVKFVPETLQLHELIISSTTGGNVTIPGEGIFTYETGTVTNLVAVATSGYRFVNWTGDVSTITNINVAETNITMISNYSIMANFAAIPTVTTRAVATISAHEAGVKIEYTVGGFCIVQVRAAYKKSTNSEWSYTNWVTKEADGWYGQYLGSLEANTQYDVKTQLKYDTTVIEGDTLQFTTGSIPLPPEPDIPIETPPCFIATAVYDTPMSEEIQILREFRDEYLLTNALGQAFVNLYYKISPPIAEFIIEHPSLKPIVRAGLVPAVVMSTAIVNTTDTQKIAIIGLLVLVSVPVAIWVIRRRHRGQKYTQA